MSKLVPYTGTFHSNHGVNIKLSPSGRTATLFNSKRVQRFAFTSTPVAANQVITIGFSLEEDLRFGFGFTTLDPNKITDVLLFEQLKRVAKTWAKDVTIFAASDDYFHFWHDKGDIIFVQDGEKNMEKYYSFPAMSKIGNVWALMYIRGENNSVTLIKYHEVDDLQEIPIQAPEKIIEEIETSKLKEDTKDNVDKKVEDEEKNKAEKEEDCTVISGANVHNVVSEVEDEAMEKSFCGFCSIL